MASDPPRRQLKCKRDHGDRGQYHQMRQHQVRGQAPEGDRGKLVERYRELPQPDQKHGRRLRRSQIRQHERRRHLHRQAVRRQVGAAGHHENP